MKALHRRSVTVALLAVFLVAVMVGTLLPPRVMAEVTSVLTGKGTADSNLIPPHGCTICFPYQDSSGMWLCHYRYYPNCPEE